MINPDARAQDPRDELVRLICLFMGTRSAEETLEKFGKVAREFANATAKEREAERTAELLRTEVAGVQAECIRATGLGISADDALSIVTRRKAGEQVDVSKYVVRRESPLPEVEPAANRIARMRAARGIPPEIPVPK